MNNVFDIKRFWNYFCWDVRNAYNNFGLSLLICGLLPAMMFIVWLIGSYVFGNVDTFGNAEIFRDTTKIMMIIGAFFVVILAFPVKQYGGLTDKKAGSTWLMLPASTLEKFISMLLVTCVVVPVCLIVMLFAVDGLLGFIPAYGNRMFVNIPAAIQNVMNEINSNSEVTLSMNIPYIVYLNYCRNILVFTLGAIFFDKSKVAKTILALLLLGFVISTIGGLSIFHSVYNENPKAFLDSFDVDKLPTYINIFFNLVNIVIFALLDLGIYFRLKTLKH